MSVPVAVVVLLHHLLPLPLLPMLLLLLVLLLPLLLLRSRTRLVALPGCEGCASSPGRVPCPAGTPRSRTRFGRRCQMLRTHYTIATLPPCTAAIFLISARRLAQRAAANRMCFCPASACRTPLTPHSIRTVSSLSPPQPLTPRSLSLLLLPPSRLSLLPSEPPTPRGAFTELPFRSGARHRRPTSELWSYGGRGTEYR